MVDEKYERIIETYLETGSIQKTAELLEVTKVKVQKVLITEGLWSSKKSLEVQHYLNLGLTTAEIAKKTFTTEKAVQQYLPYTRGFYNSDNPSVDSIKSADYRERIRIAQERTLKRNIDLVIDNGWYEMYETPDKYIKEERNDMRDTEFEHYTGELKDGRLDPVRLHLELYKGECLKLVNTEEIKKYGKVKYGNTITRDIVVPGGMPLWALNYTIQKCFGWQNSHLHHFALTDEQFKKVCDGETGKFAELVGVAFRSPWMDEEEAFWADDYETGSFKTWLKKKYTGPYDSLCHGEGLYMCKADMEKLKQRYAYARVDYVVMEDGCIFYDNLEPISKKEYEEKKPKGPVKFVRKGFSGRKIESTKEVFKFHEIPLDALRFVSDCFKINEVLERLSVFEVFAIRNKGLNDDFFPGEFVPMCFNDVMTEDVLDDIVKYQDIDSPDAQPFVEGLTDELFYHYDYGDNWCVKITASFGAADLVESGRVTQEELDNAVMKLHETYRPVCIATDGKMLLDDVGGISGYCEFLRSVYEPRFEGEGVYTDKESSLEWAKGLGWNGRMSKPDKLL